MLQYWELIIIENKIREPHDTIAFNNWKSHLTVISPVNNHIIIGHSNFGLNYTAAATQLLSGVGKILT